MTMMVPDSGETAAAQPGLKVLVVAAEVWPLAKTGGLADVVSALPKALSDLDSDIRLVIPGYPSALEQLIAPTAAAELGMFAGAELRLVGGLLPGAGLPVWLVDAPALFQRAGSPYADRNGQDWPDNARRFAALCHAAARLALDHAGQGWKPDVVHCHDWHAGLVPLLLGQAPARPRTVFTIHNAAFAGKFSFDEVRPLGLPPAAMGLDGAEFYGGFSFLKAGIRYADKITTVSPTYAREICTPEFGCGLDGLLRHRGADLVGIMNGIDAERWDPGRDRHLAQPYVRPDCGGKDLCKADLQRELGLQVDPAAPLAIFVSRITHQKMADILLQTLPDIMARSPRLQFGLLGKGDRHLEDGFGRLAAAFPKRAAVQIDHSERLEHKLHAGGDILLHGSRFEPCGLAQLYSMRYGTVPVVRRVGGLADSVIDAEAPAGKGGATGFVFDEPTGEALASTLDRCIGAYERGADPWRRLQHNAMAADFSWTRSARNYLELYGPAAPGSRS